jgi:hypothetical protein
MEETPADSAPSPDSDAPYCLCPNCAHAVNIPAGDEPILQCPQCGTQFFRPVAEDAQEKPQAATEPADNEADLNEVRIRQLSALRRTAYRTRSYYIVGVVGCLGLMVKLIQAACETVKTQHRWTAVNTLSALFALASLAGAIHFLGRVIKIQREINADIAAREQQEREAASHEPDLSSLSDGSQRAQNLHRMVGDDETPP